MQRMDVIEKKTNRESKEQKKGEKAIIETPPKDIQVNNNNISGPEKE